MYFRVKIFTMHSSLSQGHLVRLNLFIKQVRSHYSQYKPVGEIKGKILPQEAINKKKELFALPEKVELKSRIASWKLPIFLRGRRGKAEL